MGDLSANFMRREFACQGEACCNHSAPVLPALVSSLQQMRDIIGEPINITSGFRCIKHNKAIGGAEGSKHTTAEAADLALISGMTIDEMAELAKKVPMFDRGGIILYPTWIHVDVRLSGKYYKDSR
jgi:zinc D-Ala-D-Ala carboxypeptidase